jgi:UDP-N-acetylglucosamine--dolichyl-phosphate N-acetylglucosaminephosphotransferase
MATVLTVSSLVVSFLITWRFLPYWIRRAKRHGLTGKDVHKRDKKVAEAGGVVVVFGALLGVLWYIAVVVFYYNQNEFVKYIFAALCSVLIALVIGFVDDILGWRIGIRQRDKVILSFLIPIPLMVANSGHSTMTIPVLGMVDLGMLYPLLVVPAAMIGASNGFNMLAGYNGLEAGSGIIILSALGLMAWLTRSGWVAVVAFSMVASLIAFLIYNKYPSKVFPGDTLTYPVGATIAIVAILANLERFALMLFVPYFLEFVLKVKGRFVPNWKSRLLSNGALSNRGEWNTLPHVAISFLRSLKIKPYESRVVLCVLCFNLLIALVTLGYFV